jgi:hypothetical protein
MVRGSSDDDEVSVGTQGHRVEELLEFDKFNIKSISCTVWKRTLPRLSIFESSTSMLSTSAW